MISNKEISKPKTPAWALTACKSFLEQAQVVNEVLDLCMRGVGSITNFPQIVSAIAKAEGTFGSKAVEEERNRAEALKERALREINSGFSTLHSQATISLWSSLESMVKDLVSDWICNRPETLNDTSWANLKVRVGDYEPLDAEQRADYLVELADLNLGGPLKQGVTRFEKLLETIGLGGAVSDEVRKTLFELQQVRNVLVHRQGVADQRFCRTCAWMNMTPGQRVAINRERYEGYVSAAYSYASELIIRTAESFGVPDMRGDLNEREISPK